MKTIIITIFKSIIIFALTLLILIFCAGCSNSNEPDSTPTSFSIYLLEDANLKMIDIKNKDWSTLKLEQKPVLTDKDIYYYDFGCHSMYLKKDKNIYFADNKTMYSSKTWSDRPFLVVAEGKVCYIGFFKGIFSTLADREYPYIDGLDLSNSENRILGIDFFADISDKDLRINNSVKDALIKSGKLKNTLEIVLDSIYIIKGDTSTVEYTLIIKNSGGDNLHFFDPEKAGSRIFHYYTIGVSFLFVSQKKGCYAEYLKSQKPDVLKNYFTKIGSNESVKRKVSLFGYKNIEYGNYYCHMRYNCPVFPSETGTMNFSDGNSVCGEFLTNIVEIEFSKEKDCIIKNKNVIIE